jgi:hypothetical protein
MSERNSIHPTAKYDFKINFDSENDFKHKNSV